MNKLNNRDLSCYYFKHIKEFLIAFMIVQAACSSKPSSIVDTHFHNDSTLIELDVTKTYPPKEYCLQDIADVEYVKLPKKVNRELTDKLQEEAMAFIKFNSELSKAEKVNKFLQSFNTLNEFETFGLFFTEDIVKLPKIYTMKEVIVAVKEVIDIIE